MVTPAKKTVKKSSKGHAKNRELLPGLMRFSRARMFGRKAIYKKQKLAKPNVKPVKAKAEKYVTKKVEGAKNGGERKVLLKKPAKSINAQNNKIKRNKKTQFNKNHVRRLRPTLTPGTVVIILVGPHKGKRVVFLKQLASGLLLVTGPFRYNGYPLRRINQNYVLATKTKLDLSAAKVPETLNDEYFRRSKKSNRKTTEADIFSSKKQEYEVSEQRKQDQKLVDGMIIDAVKKHEQKAFLRDYLKTVFYLRKNEYPHNMVF